MSGFSRTVIILLRPNAEAAGRKIESETVSESDGAEWVVAATCTWLHEAQFLKLVLDSTIIEPQTDARDDE